MLKTSDLCADFETTTDPEDCRVWGWGLAYIDYPDSVEIHGSIEDFIDRIQYENTRIYFHNLKFDGTFLLDWLLRNNYVWLSGDEKIVEGCFKTLISKQAQYYSITVKWRTGFQTQFRDSYKKLPFPVRDVAVMFGLDMVKGEIDYHEFRPKGHIPTPDERKYIHNDVSIMAHAMRSVLDQGLTKLTVGSDSLSEFKDISGKDFDRHFPILSEDMDAEIRSAYRGGFTFADPRFRGRRIKEHGYVFDVNSLYPYVMYSKMLPFGEPRYHPEHPPLTESRPLSIFQVTFTAKLKPNHIPCIQLKNNFRFSPTEYQTEISEPVTITLTSVDWQLYKDHYDIDVLEYGPGYSFKASNRLFRKFIDKWSKIKEESTGGARLAAKLQLNSLYGKFATNPDITGKYPVLEDDRVRLIVGEPDKRDPVYTAAGVFITSWARDITVRAAQANYDSFAYADTDSLHLITDEMPEGLDIDPNKMGAWKLEYEFTEALYMRAKAYAELRADGVLETHIAGVPKHLADNLTFDDMYDGKVIEGKLIPKNVPGGVVLTDIDFVIKYGVE